MSQKKNFIFFVFLFFLLFIPLIPVCSAEQEASFFINSSYDKKNREKVTAILKRTGANLYFYVDKQWWVNLKVEKRYEITLAIQRLDREFTDYIYPTLVSYYGTEWKPGIDNDNKITVLFHPMKGEIGGYFNDGDEHPKLEYPQSNEREMIYLNTDFITTDKEKSFLAHEFTHLITYNQKNRKFGVNEEIWLNEARAEYSSTLLKYDEDYENSILKQRVSTFLNNPSDSLTEWRNSDVDYGVVHLFIQYLIHHYGIDILADSLHSNKTGIASINYALEKNGYKKRFSQIFSEWLIASVINNCQLGREYCYLNKNLKTLKIAPRLNILPFTGEASLNFINFSKDWAGRWYKIAGGQKILKFEFEIRKPELAIRVPYIVKGDGWKIDYLQLDENGHGEIYIPDFGTKNKFLIVIPVFQEKKADFGSSEPFHYFSWKASIVERTPEEEKALIEKMKAQIAYLQREITRLKKLLARALALKYIPSGFKFETNLCYGAKSADVLYLKKILMSEGLLNEAERDFFGYKTLIAVKKFQERYKEEISQFAGYEINCTGFVGKGTRAKLNAIINGA